MADEAYKYYLSGMINNSETCAAPDSFCIPKYKYTAVRTSMSRLTVKSDFAQKYMPKETTTFKIWKPKKESFWNVDYVPSACTGFFSPGWREVSLDYDLQAGDELTFTFIQPTEAVLEVVKKPKVDDCSICLEGYDSDDFPALTTCGHKFHDSCLTEWLGKQNMCPLCRTGGCYR